MATENLPAPVPMNQGGVQLTTMEDAYRFAQMVIRSELAPKGFTKPEQVMVSVQTGAEVGLSPMASLQHIPVINGRPSIMGDAALALVRQSGLMEGDLTVEYGGEGDDYGCTVTSKRVGTNAPRSHRFTVKEAKRAKLWGKPGPWVSYPDRMLYYRPLGFHMRDLYSDVMNGLAIVEEVRDFPTSATPLSEQEPPKEADPLLAAEVVDVTPEPPDPGGENYWKEGDNVDEATGEVIPDHILNPEGEAK